MKIASKPMKKPDNTPQEMQKELSASRHSLKIGIPKENQELEKRLALTPEATDMITQAGHQIFFEENAGQGVNYSDRAYAESGAIICSKEKVFKSDLIFKIAPPTPDEISLMNKKSTVCSLLQLSDMSSEVIRAMAQKSLHAVGYELMTDGFSFPVRNSISEIEGIAAISVASELLSNDGGGKGILMGGVAGVSPAEVVIIGAGVAGTLAARAALALGAFVKVFDNNINKLRKLQKDIGINIYTSVLQPNVLINAFKSADVVIGAMRYINDPVRYVISEDLIRTMKEKSLIIDLRVNQGGCFETTCFLPKDHPAVFEKYGVYHYCVSNLSSRVSRTTSMALSNIFTPLILQMGESGGVIENIKTEALFRSGLYLYSGKMVNSYVARHFNFPANDIGIYLSVF